MHYYDTLAKGVDVGYDPALEFYDNDLALALKQNLAEFSAFKETSFKNQLENLLTLDGEIVPWSDFKEKAYTLSGDYNKRWLKTEYNQTIANANSARIWQDIERNSDLYPNIKYDAVNDSRTREKHREWDGIVLPINHSFWKTNFPPQDWGCRCNGIPTDEEITKGTTNIKAKAGFDNNPGQSGKIFSETPYSKDLTGAELKAAVDQANKGVRKLPEFKEQIKAQRKEIKEWGRDKLVGKKLKHPELDKPIEFTVSGLKEFANQPYKFESEKLPILKGIRKRIKKGKYLGKNEFSKKGLSRFSHIIEIDVKDEPSWLILREDVNGKVTFYSISDSEKVTLGTKK